MTARAPVPLQTGNRDDRGRGVRPLGPAAPAVSGFRGLNFLIVLVGFRPLSHRFAHQVRAHQQIRESLEESPRCLLPSHFNLTQQTRGHSSHSKALNLSPGPSQPRIAALRVPLRGRSSRTRHRHVLRASQPDLQFHTQRTCHFEEMPERELLRSPVQSSRLRHPRRGRH